MKAETKEKIEESISELEAMDSGRDPAIKGVIDKLRKALNGENKNGDNGRSTNDTRPGGEAT